MDETQRNAARRHTAQLAAERYRKLPSWAPPSSATDSMPKKPRQVVVSGYELYLAAKQAAALTWTVDGMDSPDPAV